MFRRLLIAVFCFACLSAVAAQRFLYNPKFQPSFNDGPSVEGLGEYADYLPAKRAFSFQAARGKKSMMGEKRYSYFPSRG
uniref:Secreted protein n=1 Tax=Caenorhabditis tropicalis TaxID=1561998 RepID=A0A1I7TZG6_9PELO